MALMRGGEKVWFRETLGLHGYLRARLLREKTWYQGESLMMRVARRLLRLPMAPWAENIAYGHLDQANGIRKRAYQHGLAVLAQETLPLKHLDPGFAANMDLLASKFLLDHLYSRYEFQGMAAQYAEEHPDKDVRLVETKDVFPPLELASPRLGRVRRHGFKWPAYIGGILIAPLYLALFLKKHAVSTDKAPVEKKLLCEVDSMPIVDMFRTLAQPQYTPRFFIQPHYLQHFSDEQVKQLGLQVHGIDQTKRARLQTLLKGWLRLALSAGFALARGGTLHFDFFKTLAQGILITPIARHCTYLTFEHMSTVKAVRNELLRATGNTSVFVPFNAYAIDHFFVPEFRYNYDVLCSPCPLLEKAYVLQQAATTNILRTGGYSPHSHLVDAEAQERRKPLLAFKGDCVAITILSAGVNEYTASAEAKLMKLARELAAQPNVKVFIRQKPVPPVERYASIIKDGVKDQPNILLTHAEYKLFDFLPVTDIFISSNSSSAVDLCGAGADFYSVDFWNDPDLYLWQTEVEGVFLPPEDALGTIMAWVRDEPRGTRRLHRQRMDALRRLIAYPAGSFEAYRNRLMDQLAPWLPAADAGATRQTTPERITT